MAQKNGSGCLIAVVLMVVLTGVGIFGVIGMFFMKASHNEAERPGIEISGNPIVFQEGSFPRFPPHKRGEVLSREQFAALMIDDNATALAQKALQESANGAVVNWLLNTNDITERNGTPEGRFSLPYEIRDGHSMRGSTISIRAEFSPEGRDSLLKVRRGDWVHVQGTLSFDGQKATITEARIVDESTPPLAESP